MVRKTLDEHIREQAASEFKKAVTALVEKSMADAKRELNDVMPKGFDGRNPIRMKLVNSTSADLQQVTFNAISYHLRDALYLEHVEYIMDTAVEDFYKRMKILIDKPMDDTTPRPKEVS